MKIQLALDRLNREECFRIIKETESVIDRIEVGTGIIKEYGLTIVRDMKKAYPDKILVADMKTCDSGKDEAIQAFEAGADITTVMAFSANQTIIEMLKVAKEYDKQVMVDLLGVKDSVRLNELQVLGVNLVCLHLGKDVQRASEIGEDMFILTEGLKNMEVAIAGGINVNSLDYIKGKGIHTVIVGGAITKADNPALAAIEMKNTLS